MKEFTAQELETFSGKDEAPAYTSYEGKVYDVSESSLWIDGEHMGSHVAGRDLTEEMAEAPHGPEVLDEFSEVGTLRP